MFLGLFWSFQGEEGMIWDVYTDPILQFLYKRARPLFHVGCFQDFWLPFPQKHPPITYIDDLSLWQQPCMRKI